MRPLLSALLLAAHASPLGAQAPLRQTESDAYTLYQLLAPGSAKFRIVYEVTATTPGATHYFNPIRKGSIASDESVFDRATGKPLEFDIVGSDVARAGGVRASDSSQRYIRVTLAHPVPPDPGEARVLIIKTYEDSASYFRRGDTLVFARPLGIKRNAILLPPGYELLTSSFPAQVIQDGEGNVAISFWNSTPSEAAVTLRALPVHLARGTSWSVAARVPDRAHESSEVAYDLHSPETSTFDLSLDYTESQPGKTTHVNSVLAGNRVSSARGRNLDTGEEVAAEILEGEAITRAGLDVRFESPVPAAVVYRFPVVSAGSSIRLRMIETRIDTAGYRLAGEELVWRRSSSQPANAVVLPLGWMLTNSSIPVVVSTLSSGRVRLDFVNPRPGVTDMLVTARRRVR